MQYAVIRSGGKQLRVSPGDIIDVDRFVHDGKTISFTNVLLVSSDSTLLVGNPMVPGAVVTGTVIEDRKGQKIAVSKYKAKVRYRRGMGFRARLTRVRIEAVHTGQKASSSRREEDRVKKAAPTVRKRAKTAKVTS